MWYKIKLGWNLVVLQSTEAKSLWTHTFYIKPFHTLGKLNAYSLLLKREGSKQQKKRELLQPFIT